VKGVLEALANGKAGKYVFDLWLSSGSIFYSMATSFLWSIICIYFLSAFAEYVAWTMVIVVQIGLIAGAFVFGGLYTQASDTQALDGPASEE